MGQEGLAPSLLLTMGELEKWKHSLEAGGWECLKEDGQNDLLTYAPMSPPHIHTCPSDGRAAVGTSQASGGGRAISSASGRLASRPPLANFPEPGKESRLVGCLVGNAQCAGPAPQVSQP